MINKKHGAIELRNVRVNNLKGISLDIPHNRLIVVTGVSGSGKSSLAFDTLYAEGQRRYVESLSSYARQFLLRMNKPDFDSILGLPPAIAVEQKVNTRNSRSTVGTSTEIYDYLRMLFARVGRTYSPVSGTEVTKHSVEDVCAKIASFSHGTRFMILAPLRLGPRNTVKRQLEIYLQQGYSRIYHKNEIKAIEDVLKGPQRMRADDIHVLIDRLSVDDAPDIASRTRDSLETAFFEGEGSCRVVFLPSNITYDFSDRFEADGMSFEEPSDNMFSFNSPVGACPTCEGFGSVVGIDEKLVIPNTSLSVHQGCVQCWHGEKMEKWREEFCKVAEGDGFPIFNPYYSLTDRQKGWLWHGLPSQKDLPMDKQLSIDAFFRMVDENSYKIQFRVMQSRYRGRATCPDCAGGRLKRDATYVRIGGKNICNLVDMPITNLKKWFDELVLEGNDAVIAKRLLTEIRNRLDFLVNVGMGYLTLNRPSNTLSGGESQRINLATSLGSSLVGSLYILDEPSIGLHCRDTYRLISVLKDLRSLGNTVVVVEHDEDIIRSAEYLIDLGPDAGREGGEVVFQGEPSEIDGADAERSHTIRYLRGLECIPVPESRRRWNRTVTVKGARMNNLRNIDVAFPLNALTVVTGVSGSGKSSLVKGILYPALKRKLDEVAPMPGEHTAIEGDWKCIARVEMVDQNPIGKSTRSNPVTYVKAFDEIRVLFASQPLARQMGFSPMFFSFNADGGRCDTCKGTGVLNVEMQFMADLELVCDDCHGMRFKKDVLDVRFQGKNIHDVLEMTVAEAIEFFQEHGQHAIARSLKPLDDVGLGYIKLGQSSSTLSGGENQRVKLAYYLCQEKAYPTLFIFDEPTTGLHFHDIKKLLIAFDKLVSHGHSIIVIEHNMEIIKCADHVIDLGPEGGDKGGDLVCVGTPEDVAKCGKSETGKFLKEVLRKGKDKG